MTLKNKRIFISGGAGVIGTALVGLLLKEGADVYVGDLKFCPREWLGKLKYRQGDLNTITSEELLSFDPEIFFHLAATFERSEETYPFFSENFHHNVMLSHYLMDILKDGSSLQKVIFASSYLIYDPSSYLFETPQNKPTILDEESPIYPRNTCGGAKLFHEIELKFMEQFFKDRASFISARIFRVYGCRSRDVISRWIRAALRNETLTVFRPEGVFDYIYAEDVAEGLLRLSYTPHNGIVNVGSGNSQSVESVIDELLKYFPQLKIEMGESTILFEHSQADIKKLKNWTGWEPGYRLEMAIPKMIEFEKNALSFPSSFQQHPAVLITSLSKKVPLAEAVRTAANKLGQFQKICGCDSNGSCIGQYAVDVFWQCPPLEKLQFEQVVSFCEEHHITALIPTRDDDLEFFAKHVNSLEKRGIHTLVSNSEPISICLDKKKFADMLVKKNLPAIPTSISLDQIESSFYVVKERRGAGSSKIGIKLTKEEAAKHAALLEDPIFQPYIEGREWSVDCYRTREGRVKGCVARLRDYVQGGESQITTTAAYPELEHLCQEMADHLGLYGHAIFQVIEDEEGAFHVIECNPRFGGASTASIAAGLDTFFWFFIESLGLSLQDYPFNRRKEEVRQIRYLTDRILPWPSFLT
ncbi:MAG: ATP-grasp domain-containing protein [Candidatus Protochlamydia sp.]|nr:ATP-grasp domain-containing protein [Candidatus Protochlamydia sp.]